MQIETKFNLGDHVHHIRRCEVYQDIPCATCLESGKVTIAGDEFVCPRCKGRKLDKRTQMKWMVYDSGTIGKIEIQRYTSDAPEYLEDRETYMFTATGCGTVYNVEELFGDREAAEAECVRRNADE